MNDIKSMKALCVCIILDLLLKYKCYFNFLNFFNFNLPRCIDNTEKCLIKWVLLWPEDAAYHR